MELNKLIKYYNNFPIKGIKYVDIQPTLESNIKFNYVIDQMGKLVELPDIWIGVESRGFIFAGALAIKYGGGVRMIRKKGKLPGSNLVSVKYSLEYGVDEIQIEKSKLELKVVIVDDVIATGGTLSASQKLCELANFKVIDILTFIDLGLIKTSKFKSLYKL